MLEIRWTKTTEQYNLLLTDPNGNEITTQPPPFTSIVVNCGGLNECFGYFIDLPQGDYKVMIRPWTGINLIMTNSVLSSKQTILNSESKPSGRDSFFNFFFSFFLHCNLFITLFLICFHHLPFRYCSVRFLLLFNVLKCKQIFIVFLFSAHMSTYNYRYYCLLDREQAILHAMLSNSLGKWSYILTFSIPSRSRNTESSP